jgi:hypothetical protein
MAACTLALTRFDAHRAVLLQRAGGALRIPAALVTTNIAAEVALVRTTRAPR